MCSRPTLGGFIEKQTVFEMGVWGTVGGGPDSWYTTVKHLSCRCSPSGYTLLRATSGGVVASTEIYRPKTRPSDPRDEREEVTLGSRKLQRTHESLRVNRYGRRHVHARIKEATLQSLGKSFSCRGIPLLTLSKGIWSFSTVCAQVFEWTQRGLLF